jgi:NADPH2:quinone reductase
LRAARITEYGGSPSVVEIEPPEIGEGRVEVEVELAGINPVDLAIASGRFDAGAPPLPYTPGLEGIGLMPDGQRVWFDRPMYPVGSLAERCSVDPATAIPVPDGVAPAEAIAFGVAGMAAWLPLSWRGKLEEGESVLILGASGSVGQIAVQAARLLGAGRVVAAARSEAGREKALGLGADAAISTEGSSEAVADLIREACPGGPDLVLDGLWGAPAEAALAAIAPHGRLLQVGNSAAKEAQVTAGPLRGGLVSILGHRNFHAPVEVQAEAFRRMCALSASGELVIETQVFDLDSVADAWKLQATSPGRKLAVAPGA